METSTRQSINPDAVAYFGVIAVFFALLCFSWTAISPGMFLTSLRFGGPMSVLALILGATAFALHRRTRAPASGLVRGSLVAAILNFAFFVYFGIASSGFSAML